MSEGYKVGSLVHYLPIGDWDPHCNLPGVVLEKIETGLGRGQLDNYTGTPGYEFKYKVLWSDPAGAWVGGWKWHHQLVPWGSAHD